MKLKGKTIYQNNNENHRKPATPALMFVVSGLVVLLFALKCWATANMELLPEEAYYWTYAQHPALSFYDHPPMVAWTIRLGTSIFGDTEFGVRFGTLMLAMGSTILIFITSRLWFGLTTALWACLIFTLSPLYAGIGFLATTDGPLVFFWLLTLCFLSKALLSRRTGYWLAAGIGLGAAMLSKYSGVMLAPGLLLFLLSSPTHRFWLSRWQPWIAFLIGFVVFTPVIVWNAQHDWVSFLFQATRTVDQKPQVFHYVLEFWLSQLVILTPPVFVLTMAAAWRAIRKGWGEHQDHWNFAVSFFLPPFLVFFVASFATSVHVNWTAPVYLSMLPAVAAFVLDSAADQVDPAKARRWQLAGTWSLAFCGAVILLALSTLTLGIPAVLSLTPSGGWRQLANLVEETRTNVEMQTGQKPFIVGVDKLYIAAEIGFYTGAPKETVNQFALGFPGVGYQYWTDLQDFAGRPAIAIMEEKLWPLTTRILQPYCEKLHVPHSVKFSNVGGRERRVKLITCYGYRPPTDDAEDSREQQ
jgi:dolichol-phosphate mannosyltransferase